MIWGLWWPVMVWLAVLFGRLWCAVCPLELVSNLSERIGRRLKFPQRPLSLWVASGAVIVALYLLIQMLVAGAELHRTPAYTSYFFLGLIAMAAATGLLFKDRAFCRGFCPVALLLNVYGRGGVLAVRPASGPVCESCPGHYCAAAIGVTTVTTNAARASPTGRPMNPRTSGLLVMMARLPTFPVQGVY